MNFVDLTFQLFHKKMEVNKNLNNIIKKKKGHADLLYFSSQTQDVC